MRSPHDSADFEQAEEPGFGLSDEQFEKELETRGYARKSALVQESSKRKSQSASARQKAQQRKRQFADGIQQFNVDATSDPYKRDLIRRAAKAISSEDSQDGVAIIKVLQDHSVRDLVIDIATREGFLAEIESALDNEIDAERGRRTSAPDVTAAIDALLESEMLRKLVELLAHADRRVLELLATIAKDRLLMKGTVALAADPALLNLCLGLSKQSELIKIFAKTAASPTACAFFTRAWLVDKAMRHALINALDKPELLMLVTSASSKNSGIIPALRITIANPDSPALGLKVKRLRGLSRWLVDQLVGHA